MKRGTVLLQAGSVLVGGLFLLPLGYLVYRSATVGGRLFGTLTSRGIVEPLVRSLVLASTVALAAAALGLGLAWLTERTDLPARRLFRVLIPLPLVIPSFVGAAAFVAAFSRGGLFAGPLERIGLGRVNEVRGFIAAFVVLTLLTQPYVYLPVAARLRALPASLEESGRLLGRRPRQVFVTIVLPQVTGAVMAGSLLVFLYVVSDFGAVSILRYDTLTRAIHTGFLLDRRRSLTLSLCLAALAIIVVVAEQLVVRRGRFAPPTGAAPFVMPLGRWKPVAFGAAAVPVGLGLLAPLAVLGYWAWRGLARGGLGSGEIAADVGRLAGPAVNSAFAGAVTGAAAVVLVLPVAYLTARTPTIAGRASAAAVVAGFALPGLVIALSLAFFALQAPAWLGLYQTLPLLLLAYIVHFGAQALRAAQVALAGVPPPVDDAARVLGAGALRRLLTIDLPLMAPGLLAGAGLVLMSTMKELPATLLLAPIGFSTLSTKVWDAYESGLFADLGLASLVLVAVSAVLTWRLVLRNPLAEVGTYRG